MPNECCLSYLINERTFVLILLPENVGPEIWIATFDEVAGFTLKQRVLVAHLRWAKDKTGLMNKHILNGSHREKL